MGSARFESVPPGAEVWIDSTDQGTVTPAVITGIPAGFHAYKLKLAGYNEYTGTVNVPENQTAGVTATMTRSPNAGWIIGLSLAGLAVAKIALAFSGEKMPSIKCAVEREGAQKQGREML